VTYRDKKRLPHVEVKDGAAYLNGQQLALPKTLVMERELLPRGANAFVFLAMDGVLQRKVVVKVWLPKANDSRPKIAQGQAEARKIASVRHPNIAEVFSAGCPSPDLFFLTMEYLQGKTLKQWLEAGDIDFYERYHVWLDISKALQFAHKSGVYHGDLHGNNVIVVGKTPKVIDFGTSLFAKRRRNPKNRESRLLVELVSMMFAEHTLSQLASGDWSRLSPEIALAACVGWSKLLWVEHDLLQKKELRKQLDDYDCKNAAFRTCIILRNAPLFKMDCVTNWFRGIVEAEWCVLMLLDSIKAHFLNVFDHKNQFKMHYDTDETATEKLAALGELAVRVQCHFLETGPWE